MNHDGPDMSAGDRIRAEDAFFLHVESAAVPQHVGGLAILDTSGRRAPLARDDLAALVAARLLPQPKFRHLLDVPGRLARPRWREASAVDLHWHVTEAELPPPGGERGLRRFVAAVAETPLPRDRPLWRFWLVPGVGSGRTAVMVVMHHVLGDGTGVISDLRSLLTPAGTWPGSRRLPGGPGPVRRAVATVTGLAQLATDGSAPYRLDVGAVTAARQYLTVTMPLDTVRAAALAHRTRVTDVLLAAVAAAAARMESPADGGDWPGARLRTSVTMLLRPPGTPGPGSNRTAAVMVDLPVRPMPAAERLAVVASAADRRRRTGRALASRFVMTRGAASLPGGLQARFARSVYRGRYFGAIVSNMPGPPDQLALLGAPLREVYPILPLAAEVPLAVGALSWHGGLHLGITVATSVVPDGEAFAAALRAGLVDLGAA
jgi:diacylglycerol O-acyltransferase